MTYSYSSFKNDPKLMIVTKRLDRACGDVFFQLSNMLCIQDKTKNAWDQRNNFVKHDGKYMFVEIDENDDGTGLSPQKMQLCNPSLARWRIGCAAGKAL